jgi:LPXTG-motif cell wall-anchored protein
MICDSGMSDIMRQQYCNIPAGYDLPYTGAEWITILFYLGFILFCVGVYFFIYSKQSRDDND